MKSFKVKKIVVALLMATALIFTSCDMGSTVSGANEVTDSADTTDLDTAIAAALAVLDSIIVGSDTGNISQADYDTYQNAIDAAQAVCDTTTVTDTEVTEAITTLATATTQFNADIITDVEDGSESNLPLQVAGITDQSSTASTIYISWGAWTPGEPEGDVDNDGWDESVTKFEVVFSADTSVDPDTLTVTEIATTNGIPGFPVTVTDSATAETSYGIWVRAVNAEGNGPWSEMFALTTAAESGDSDSITGATDPTTLAGNTVIYSDVTDGEVIASNIDPVGENWWGALSSSIEDLDGNNAIKYTYSGAAGECVGITFDEEYIAIGGLTTFKADVYPTESIINFQFKLVTSGGEPLKVLVSNIDVTPGQWNTITWDLSNETMGDKLTKIGFIIADGGAAGQAVYVDNMYFEGVGTAAVVTGPDAGVDAPTLASTDVVSMYTSTGTYTDAEGVTWDAQWGQGGSLVDYTAGTSTVKKLELVNYQGIDFDSNRLDITGKTTLHLSYWSAADTGSTGFDFYPIWDGGEAGTTVSLTNDGTWRDLEIDLSGLSGIDTTSIRQLKFDCQTNGSAGVVYFDNIYFH